MNTGAVIPLLPFFRSSYFYAPLFFYSRWIAPRVVYANKYFAPSEIPTFRVSTKFMRT